MSTQTYTIAIVFQTVPCSVCGVEMIHGLHTPNHDANDSLKAQGAIIATTTPYHGRKYVCPACAAKSPDVWCIGCHEPSSKHGIFEQSESDPAKCLCQRCYWTLTAAQFDDLRHELNSETEAG